MKYAPQKFLCHSYYFLFGMLGTGMLPALIGRFEDRYQLSHGQMGTLMGVSGVLFAAASIFMGSRHDRFGPRRVLSLSILLGAVTAVGLYLAPDVWLFVPALLAFQTANGMTQSVNATVSHLYGEKRFNGINLLHGSQGVGRLLAPLVVIACLTVWGDWRGVFLLAAAMFAVWSLLCWIGFKDAAAQTADSVESGRGAQGHVLANPVLWLGLTAYVFLTGGEISCWTWIPVYLEKEEGFPRDLALSSLTSMMIGYTVVRLAAAFLLKKKAASFLIAASGLISVVCYLLLIRVHGVAGMFVVTFFWGVAFGAWWPLMIAAILEAVPENQGMVTGLCNCSSSAGILIFTSAIGWAGDAWGLRVALAIGVGAAVIFAVLFCAFVRAAARQRRL